jgi:hypothetical protein
MTSRRGSGLGTHSRRYARSIGISWATASARGRALRALAICACAVLVAAMLSGCAPYDPKRGAIIRPPDPKTVQLQAARTAVAPVFAQLDACEASVRSGGSLEELATLSRRARYSAVLFSQGPYSKVLPNVTSALLNSSADYGNACAVWRAQDNGTRVYWLDGTTSQPNLDKIRRYNRYYVLWVGGAVNLGKARTALKDGPL